MSVILVERSHSAALATVRLNRPDKRNAMTLDMWRELREVFTLLEQDVQVRCVVVRGTSGHFAAGADLSEFPALRATAEQAETYGRQMVAALTAIRDCRHPTIAAIEGLCVGGGLEIALMCDLRLGAADSRYGVPIQKVGVAMPYPELAILTHMLGRPTMLALLLEGQLHDASWAERHGLLTRTVADLEAELAATIGRILTGSPASHRHHKSFTQRAVDVLQSLDAEDIRRSYAAVESEDYREGIDAFLARRTPKFPGN
ncbi:enoyl-CoA hydratase/isomerase family protein [Dongia deserti]|uniref:enoyl-CoA hydratase/isomerase family protein n=1 Tax=Dongia deserti TaxID=2268030 RepID=UPI002548FE6F|nr:enoyl-CoA hydratase/isomerase family protein [Dongia deserti]